MNDLINYEQNIFENIKHIDEEGNEYWLARELQKVLEYKEWRKFSGVINKAIKACEMSNYPIINHFVQSDKTITMPKNATKTIIDYKLSRYACYLVAQNGDSHMEKIALAQTYFAIQTRKQELSEIESKLEDERRLFTRGLTRKGNLKLNKTAKNAGVKNFAKFHNAGYKGLYGGETADDIAKRKHLRYREDILDNMGSSELIANMFRIDLTEQKIRKEEIKGEDNANNTHYIVGKKVRDTIKEMGGTLPENLSTPKKSIKELETKDMFSVYSE